MKRHHMRHGRVQRLKAKLYRRLLRSSGRAFSEWFNSLLPAAPTGEVLTVEKFEKAIKASMPKVGTLWFNTRTRETLKWDGCDWVPWPSARVTVRPDGAVVVTEVGTLPGCEVEGELRE